MPGPRPPPVPRSEAERQARHTMPRAHQPPPHLRVRAQMLLLWVAGLEVSVVARRFGTTRTTVRRWRRHGLTRPGGPVPERWQAAERPGAPATCSAAQWCQMMALACEPPEASARPMSPWTPRELAEEARTRGLGAPISARQVGRLFKAGRAQATPQSVLAQRGT
jgi:putative transposase